MYRSLSPKAMGITGRQSEIIELALTYGFRGLELDIYDFAKRVEHRGLEHAARFIRSSQLKIGGFEVPVRWRGEDAVYRADMEKLDTIAGYAAAIGAKQCHTVVLPVSNNFPYHENFEVHRRRLGEMATVLEKHGIRLGVGLLAAQSHRDEQQYQFIREAEPLLMLLKSVGNDNLGSMLDTWNWHFAGGTRDAVQALGSKGIVSVYVAEAARGRGCQRPHRRNAIYCPTSRARWTTSAYCDRCTTWDIAVRSRWHLTRASSPARPVMQSYRVAGRRLRTCGERWVWHGYRGLLRPPQRRRPPRTSWHSKSFAAASAVTPWHRTGWASSRRVPTS